MPRRPFWLSTSINTFATFITIKMDAKFDKKRDIRVRQKSIHLETLADQLGDAHVNILPVRKIIYCLLTLGLANIVSFSDQTGITVALSLIADDLDARSTINWAGTASLLANCVCQVLFGRLGDIFGRKNILMACLVILAIADIACGVSRTGVEFYVFRAMAGIGNGGVSSLSMVILSDIVTLKQRGKYQGILGSSVGVGNAVGPFIMAAFIQQSSWRLFYYLLSPLCVVVLIAVYFLIDGRKEQLDSVLSNSEKFKKIDYLGIFFATAALTLLLVPISGGGTSYPWNSPLIITLLVVGGVSFIGFLIIEWKVAKLPMVPLHLFRVPSLCLLLSSNFLFGATYFSFTYYLPYYFRIIKGYSALHTSVFVLPLVLCQALMSVVAGQLISYTGHYIYIVGTGYSLWLIGNVLLVLWNESLKDGICVLTLLIMGTGVGWTFQPTMVAVQAQARKADRAVVISTRNVMRSFGGAVGIAIGSTVFSNTLLNGLNSKKYQDEMPQWYINQVRHHMYSHIPTENVSTAQVHLIQQLYVKSLKNYFYLLIPFIGICLISSFFVKDRGLQCIDELPQKKIHDESSAASSHTVYDSRA